METTIVTNRPINNNLGSMTLQKLHTVLKDRESKELPDKVIPMSELRVDDDLNIVVPGDGSYQMNSWARSQLNSLLGLKFDRWFENTSLEEKAFELNRRFARATNSIKLRATSDFSSANPYIRSDGVIQAFVSPNFSVIPDSLVCELLLYKECHDIISASITEKTVSFQLKITEFDNPKSQSVGKLYGALSITNSNTGYASLTLDCHLYRLLCSNGMSTAIDGANLLKRKHCGSAAEDTMYSLLTSMRDIKDRLQMSVDTLNNSQNYKVADIENDIATIIRQARLSRKLAPTFIEAWHKEPMETVFGITNAITDSETHKLLELQPEERRQLQDAAADYMAKHVY
ncbi:MAG: DUF932 domain-containing protein [Candidatus Riflebacteria bacterium]|nr:DUF932 domain-containing protein [Candidatus Riflebacteria bacterium]